ncbi:hypothetical protein F2Q69_00056316 [Brassica cretica]|uniref:Uncharacterized protein n=1 Tax=Brassica cretica TaxID=69181 RepID=A0A8S9N1D5_BRACR|nr:hypothetical protein F2Q69_00056316 [Brassica cretica]
MSSFFDARTRVAILDDEGARVTRASHLHHISFSPEIQPSDLSTKRSSAAPPNLTANIFGPLKPERIDRHGEISSTTVHRNHPKKISHAT